MHHKHLEEELECLLSSRTLSHSLAHFPSIIFPFLYTQPSRVACTAARNDRCIKACEVYDFKKIIRKTPDVCNDPCQDVDERLCSVGNASAASGDASVALGKGASAAGAGAAALGMFTRANGLGSTAAGRLRVHVSHV